MERSQKRYALTFSPLFSGLGTSLFTSLSLILLIFLGPRPPRYIWLGLLLFVFLGFGLQIGSRRVLVYRAYDTAGWSLATIGFATVAWSVVGHAWGQNAQVLASVVISILLIFVSGLTYVLERRNPQRAWRPYGPVGRLNPNTGVIVDLTDLEPARWLETPNTERLKQVIKLSPLIAGLTMLLARSLPNSLALLVLVPLGLILSSITARFAAMFLGYAVSTLCWEQRHGKAIHVKR